MGLRNLCFLLVLSALVACGSNATATVPTIASDPTSTPRPTATGIPTLTSQPPTATPQRTDPPTEVPATTPPPPTPTFTPVPEPAKPVPVPASTIPECVTPDQTAALVGPPGTRTIALQLVEESGNGSSDGDVHVNTPDGLNYDFQAIGEFIAVKDASGDLEFQVRQEPWGSSTVVSVNTAVAMNIAGDRVGIYLGEDPPLFVNGLQSALTGQAMKLENGGQIQQSGGAYTMVWPDQTRATVTLRGGFLTLIFSLCPGRSGKISGLFGNYDGIAGNDLTARDGEVVSLSGADGDEYYRQLYRVFGDSWRIDEGESLFIYSPGESTDTFTDLDFPYFFDPAAELSDEVKQNAEAVCLDAGVTNPVFLADCILDVGVTADASFAQSAAETQVGLEEIDEFLGEFTCLIFVEGFSECRDRSLIEEDILAGSDYEIFIETLVGSEIVVEGFICGPVLPSSFADCSFQTEGQVFEGGETLLIYELATGGQVEYLVIWE